MQEVMLKALESKN